MLPRHLFLRQRLLELRPWKGESATLKPAASFIGSCQHRKLSDHAAANGYLPVEDRDLTIHMTDKAWTLQSKYYKGCTYRCFPSLQF